MGPYSYGSLLRSRKKRLGRTEERGKSRNELARFKGTRGLENSSARKKKIRDEFVQEREKNSGGIKQTKIGSEKAILNKERGPRRKSGHGSSLERESTKNRLTQLKKGGDHDESMGGWSCAEKRGFK